MTNEILDNIGQRVYKDLSIDSPNYSLMSGKIGACLFLTNLYLKTGDSKYIDRVYEVVEKAIEAPPALFRNMTLCNGLSGFIWFLKFLQENDLIDGDLDQLIGEEIQPLLFDYASESFTNNWDYLHGSLGVAHVFKEKEVFQNLSSSKLKNIAQSEKGQTYWMQELNDDDVNFGLAHGIPSILFYLKELYKTDSEIRNLVDGGFLTLEKNKLPKGMNSIYSNRKGSEMFSRLAWCYGDLAIAHVASKFVKHEQVGLEVAIHCASRRDEKNTLIKDAGFCHGASGIAQLFRSLNQTYENAELKNAQVFWTKKSIDLLIKNDFKFWDGSTSTWNEDYSLLNGLSGVGLMLLGLDNGWDDCFMLS